MEQNKGMNDAMFDQYVYVYDDQTKEQNLKKRRDDQEEEEEEEEQSWELLDCSDSEPNMDYESTTTIVISRKVRRLSSDDMEEDSDSTYIPKTVNALHLL